MDMMAFLAAFLVFYIWHMLGVTIGYHRLLAHRSYRCPKIVEYFWVMAGYLGFESSPIWWTTIHRAHHRFTDTEKDPHSPLFGLFRSHTGWIFGKEYPDYLDPAEQTKDLVNDPLYRFLERGGNWHKAHLTNSAIGFGFRGVLWILFGWQIALASLLAGLLAQQMPFMVNVVCHIPKLGYKNFGTDDQSVNVWWLAIITLGEGWHNNHHAYPGCARAGLKPHEFDFSFGVVKVMSWLKLASYVNERFELEDLALVDLTPAAVLVAPEPQCVAGGTSSSRR